MPLGTEVGLVTGDVVLDGEPAPPQRGTAPSFRPMSIVAKRVDGSRRHLVRTYILARATLLEGRQLLPAKGAQHPPPFRPMSIVAMVAHLSYC